MAGIGNYVHYWTSNYNKYGTSIDSDGSSVGFQKATEEAKEKLKSITNINKNKVNYIELENFLTDLVYHKTNTLSLNGKNYDETNITNWEQEFLKLIEEKFPTLQANLSDLTFNGIEGLQTGVKFNPINLKNKSGIKKSSIDKAKENLNQIVTNLGKDKKYEALGEEIKNLNRELNTILKKEEADRDYIIPYTDDAKNIFKKYNYIIHLIQGLTTKDTGDLAELYFSYMIAAAYGVAAETLDDLMGLVVGNNRQNLKMSGFDSGIINADILVEALNEGKTSPNTWSSSSQSSGELGNGSTFTITLGGAGSQETVDMSITLPEGELNASIKNYKSIEGFYNKALGKHEGIHIVSGYSVMSALMLVDTNFVNHYLNILASRPGAKDLVNEANTVLKQAVAVRALTGARNITNNITKLSEMLIVNDRSAQRVRVVPTAILFSKIFDKIDEYTLTKGLPTHVVSKWIGEGPNLDDAYLRITNLIATMHSFKLSMSLLPNAFSKIGP